MPRLLFTFFLLMIAGHSTMAQLTPGTNIFQDPADSSIERQLIELALKSPRYKVSEHQRKLNELELKRTKNSWLNFLTISTSYNDQSFAKQNPTSQIVYPKYFFTLGIPLGLIFSHGTQVKTARTTVAMAQDNQEEMSRTIKADILSKYKQYKLYNTLIAMQTEMINDVSVNATQAEESFKKGLITVEVYISTQKSANEELAKNLNLKLQQEMLRLEIESIIGVPLDSILKPTNK